MKIYTSTAEVWEVLPECPNYAVSNLGRVKQITKGNRTRIGYVLSPSCGSSGYMLVRLSQCRKGQDRQEYTRNVHRLVAQAFLGPCPLGLQVNHKDGDKTNNVVWNLEYVTPSQNACLAFQAGLRKSLIGEEHPNSKLTADDVREIKQELSRSVSMASLGRRFNVALTTIQAIKTGRNWRHIEL